MTLACPICAVPEGAQVTAGVRAGALALAVVTLAVLGTLGTFFVREWRAERKPQ